MKFAAKNARFAEKPATFCKTIISKNVIIYYDNSLNEGLIGIIAARLKDHFNKPSIVITKSNNILKASARSTTINNIGGLIKLLIYNKL